MEMLSMPQLDKQQLPLVVLSTTCGFVLSLVLGGSNKNNNPREPLDDLPSHNTSKRSSELATQQLSIFDRMWLLPLINRSRHQQQPTHVKLEPEQLLLPTESYPNREGFEALCKYFRAHLSYLPRRREFHCGPRRKGHTYLMMNVVRRATAVGSLHEKLRAVDRLFGEVRNENMQLTKKISVLKNDQVKLEEELQYSQRTCAREVELRTAAESEREYMVEHRESLQRELADKQRQLNHLRTLLEETLAREQGFVDLSTQAQRQKIAF